MIYVSLFSGCLNQKEVNDSIIENGVKYFDL